MLRKSFLVIGIVLLILGFFFFYWASRVNWDYMTTYKDTVDISYLPGQYDFEFGSFFPYPTYPYVIEMQPNDYLTAECPSLVSNGQITLMVYKVLFEIPSMTQMNKTQVLEYETGLVRYTNYQSHEVGVGVDLAIPVSQVPNDVTILENMTVSTTITLHHYETPQWAYFGIGVFLSSLAVVSIVKSLSKPKPCSAEGSRYVTSLFCDDPPTSFCTTDVAISARCTICLKFPVILFI